MRGGVDLDDGRLSDRVNELDTVTFHETHPDRTRSGVNAVPHARTIDARMSW